MPVNILTGTRMAVSRLGIAGTAVLLIMALIVATMWRLGRRDAFKDKDTSDTQKYLEALQAQRDELDRYIKTLTDDALVGMVEEQRDALDKRIAKVREDARKGRGKVKTRKPGRVTPKPLMHDLFFAPYVESWKDIDLTKVPCKNFVLAFLLSNGKGELAWNATEPVAKWRDQIAKVQASGGRVILSLGGAAGTELAEDVKDPAELAEKYGNVTKDLGCNWLDFDIEGGALDKTDVNTRRHKAIALMQAKLPNVYVSFTVPVMPTGLLDNALDMLRDAAKQGVRIDCVNVMAMNYGPGYTKSMYQYAVWAAIQTWQQLLDIGDITVGITPMIGKNDSGGTFTLKDAKLMRQHAERFSGPMFFWSLGRDNGKKISVDESSMLTQKTYDFTREFDKRNK